MFHRLRLQGQDGQMLRKLPAEYSIVGSRFEGSLVVLGALVMGIEPAYGLLMSEFSFGGYDLLRLLFVAVCGVLIVAGIDQFFVSGTVTVTPEEVALSKKSLIFNSQWKEPISAYEGIRTALTGKHEGGDTVINKWQVWLHHKRRGKRIKLVESNMSQYIEEDAIRYCELFRLPRIQ